MGFLCYVALPSFAGVTYRSGEPAQAASHDLFRLEFLR